MPFAFTIGALALGLFAQCVFPKERGRERIVKMLCAAAVFIVAASVLCLMAAQYMAWSEAGPPAAYLVPPHQSMSYVISYVFAREGASYAVSLTAALALAAVMTWANRRHKERFFEKEEPYLAALAVFLLGDPSAPYAWLWYIGAVLLAAALSASFRLLITSHQLPVTSYRFSLYYLWLPLALGVILVESLR